MKPYALLFASVCALFVQAIQVSAGEHEPRWWQVFHKKQPCPPPCPDPCADPCAEPCAAPCPEPCKPPCNVCGHQWHLFKKKPCTSPDDPVVGFGQGDYAKLAGYYDGLSRENWVGYYKNHGQQMPGGEGGPGVGTRIHYAAEFPLPPWQMPQSYGHWAP